MRGSYNGYYNCTASLVKGIKRKRGKHEAIHGEEDFNESLGEVMNRGRREVKKKAWSGFEKWKKVRFGERGGLRTSVTVHYREKKMIGSSGNVRDDMLVLVRVKTKKKRRIRRK